MAFKDYWRGNGKAIISRLVPYWLTVVAALWSIAFLYIWLVDEAYDYYETAFAAKVSVDTSESRDGVAVPT